MTVQEMWRRTSGRARNSCDDDSRTNDLINVNYTYTLSVCVCVRERAYARMRKRAHRCSEPELIECCERMASGGL